LAKYSGWNDPTITDSGGFQVMSLGTGLGKVVSMDKRDIADLERRAEKKDRLAKVDDDGVSFIHFEDGKEERFTPEVSMQIQHKIGADIMMAFDELTSIGDSYEYNIEALERTRKWAERSLKEHQKLSNENPGKPYQALYGVLQGAHYQDLREKAAKDLGGMDFDGYGLGGAFEKEQLGQILDWVCSILPEEKPRHLLGLSKPDDIFIGVSNGADTFDCVAPTREARHGRLYLSTGSLQIQNAKWKEVDEPIFKGCECPTCKSGHTLKSLRRDYKDPETKDKTLSLLSIHNLFFINNLFAKIRESIIDGTFEEYKTDFLSKYNQKSS
jgi:queuine tRNA-ribosyltransferase